MFFIIEGTKDTVLDFSKGTIKVLLFNIILIFRYFSFDIILT